MSDTKLSNFTFKLSDSERGQLDALSAAHGRMSAGAYLRLLIAHEHAALLQGQRGIPAPAPRKPTPADLHELVSAERHRRAKAGEPSFDENSLAYEPLDAP